MDVSAPCRRKNREYEYKVQMVDDDSI